MTRRTDRVNCNHSQKSKIRHRPRGLRPKQAPDATIRAAIIAEMDRRGWSIWDLARHARLAHTTAWRWGREDGAGLNAASLSRVLDALDLEIVPRGRGGGE